MDPRPWQLALLLLVAGLGPLPAGAHHGFPGGHLPLLDRGEVPGGGWVAIRFSTEGEADLAYEHWVVSENATGLQVGARLYEADGHVAYTHILTGLSLQDGLHVRASPIELESGHVEPRFNDSFLGTGDAWDGTNRTRLDGEHTLLLWGVGNAPDTAWSYFVRGGPGVDVLGVASGEDARLLLSADFSADAEAQARGGDNPLFPQANLGAQATFAGVHRTTAERRLVAFFDGFDGVVARTLHVELPDGDERVCPCFLDRTPAGEYAFHLTSVGAELGGTSGEVFLALLDLDLPEWAPQTSSASKLESSIRI